MSQSPPMFNPAQKQPGSKVWLWVLLGVVGFCTLAIIGIFFFAKGAMKTVMTLGSCAINAEIARDSVLAYTQEHDGTFPKAETWQDDIRPYYERIYQKKIIEEGIEKMPDWFKFEIAKPGEPLECHVGEKTTTGFAFNALLSATNIKDVKDPSVTILIWETMTSSYNANGDPSKRSKPGEKFKFFGQERDYIDMYVEGEADFLESGNADFNIEISPEDGLEKEPVPAKNPEPRPKEEVK